MNESAMSDINIIKSQRYQSYQYYEKSTDIS